MAVLRFHRGGVTQRAENSRVPITPALANRFALKYYYSMINNFMSPRTLGAYGLWTRHLRDAGRILNMAVLGSSRHHASAKNVLCNLWRNGAEKLRQAVYGLRDLQETVDSWNEIVGWRLRTYVKEVSADLLSLESQFPDAWYDTRDQAIGVLTRPVVLEWAGEEYPLGKFEMRLRENGKCYITSEKKNVMRNGGVHPHVFSDGQLCTGDGDNPAKAGKNTDGALHEGRLVDFFQLTEAVLHTYTHEDAVNRLPRPDNSDGEDEDEDEDEIFYCEHCNHSTDSVDAYTCDECGYRYCPNCSARCDGCDCIYCDECGEFATVDDRLFCCNCYINCEECGTATDRDDVIACEDLLLCPDCAREWHEKQEEARRAEKEAREAEEDEDEEPENEETEEVEEVEA